VRIGEAGRLSPELATVKAADSLGSVYATVTALLGMVPLEHEYKLMGMAPYAPEAGAERSYQQFKDVLRFSEPDGLSWERARACRAWSTRTRGSGAVGASPLRLGRRGAAAFHRGAPRDLGPQRDRATGVRKVALGGGVFMNVKANQRIYELERSRTCSSSPRAATRPTRWVRPSTSTSGRAR
jgi:carbamoyltransferase